ncbi:hypothetical protein BE21_02505 [Sorangium cellulosum]|uniref:Uncharacterized protein n=1 Tax=Sorangium cellulosum TaxID=56 RepID=A0A150TRV5_SORCE|nr:hypothetical protein BE21_02505 [Sorangium cellulosum]
MLDPKRVDATVLWLIELGSGDLRERALSDVWPSRLQEALSTDWVPMKWVRQCVYNKLGGRPDFLDGKEAVAITRSFQRLEKRGAIETCTWVLEAGRHEFKARAVRLAGTERGTVSDGEKPASITPHHLHEAGASV